MQRPEPHLLWQKSSIPNKNIAANTLLFLDLEQVKFILKKTSCKGPNTTFSPACSHVVPLTVRANLRPAAFNACCCSNLSRRLPWPLPRKSSASLRASVALTPLSPPQITAAKLPMLLTTSQGRHKGSTRPTHRGPTRPNGVQRVPRCPNVDTDFPMALKT